MICGTGFVLVDVDDVWPSIAERARATTRSHPAVLAYIRERCLAADALCLKSDDGVVILAARGAVLHVLLAVGTGLQGAFKRQESAMLAIARDLGAKELVFDTDRRGWVKVLGPEWHEHDGRFTRGV
jgi:hypothetical protein